MQYVNLLPEEFLLHHRVRTHAAWWTAASAVVVLGLAAGAVVLSRRAAAAQQRVAELTKRRKELDERIARLQQLNTEREKLQCRQRIIDSLLDRRSLCLLFADLAKRASDLVWLESISVSEPEEAATPSGSADSSSTDSSPKLQAPGPREVMLTGFATTNAELARFMSALKRSKLIKDPVLEISKTEHFLDKQATRFEIAFKF